MANTRKTHEVTERNYSNQSRRDIHPDYYNEKKPSRSIGNNEDEAEREGETYQGKFDNNATRLVRPEDEDRSSKH